MRASEWIGRLFRREPRPEEVQESGPFRICDPLWVSRAPCPHCGASNLEYHRPPNGKPIYGPATTEEPGHDDE